MDISKYKWRKIMVQKFEAHTFSAGTSVVASIFKSGDGWYVHHDPTVNPHTYTSLKDVDNIEEAKAVVEAILRLS